MVRIKLFQCEIMRDAEDPGAKVFPRSPQLEMLKEGQEHFLDDFFGIVHGYAESKCIPKQWIAKLVKQLHDLALDFREILRWRRVPGDRERQPVDRIRGRHRLGSPKVYIPFSPLLFKVFDAAFF